MKYVILCETWINFTSLPKKIIASILNSNKNNAFFIKMWYIIVMEVNCMTMQSVSIKIPDAMVEYADVQNENAELMRNAMILFPYIQNETISHGKAAQILGIHKMDLIALYSTLGIPYLDQTKEELESDVSVLRNLRSRPA